MMQILEPQPNVIQIQTGKISGFSWTIETIMERRTGFRLFVDHKPIATFATYLDAVDIRDAVIANKVVDLRDVLDEARDNTTIGAAYIAEVERRLNKTTTCDEAVALIEV